jgi:acetyl esterase
MAIDPGSVSFDPQVKILLGMLETMGRISYRQITPPGARAQFVELCRHTGKSAAVDVTAHDLSVPTPSGRLRVRLYRPAAAASVPMPALVYFHGGGWCMGDIDTHDPICRQLSAEAQCAVLSVDYRLAPECRFPAAVEDSFDALRFAVAESASLGLDPARIAIGGDSAGGNLATVSAIRARDTGIPLAAQVLIYPATDVAGRHASQEDYAEGFALTRESITWFVDNYIDVAARQDWRASPLYAPDLSGLPPTLIIVGEFDPLVDQNRRYAERLRAAGTAVDLHVYPGMIHGFLNMGGVLDAADHAVMQSARLLRQVFAVESTRSA